MYDMRTLRTYFLEEDLYIQLQGQDNRIFISTKQRSTF